MKTISTAIAAALVFSAAATTVWAANPAPAAVPGVATANVPPANQAVAKKPVKPAKRVVIKTNNAKPMSRIQIRHPSTPYNP